MTLGPLIKACFRLRECVLVAKKRSRNLGHDFLRYPVRLLIFICWPYLGQRDLSDFGQLRLGEADERVAGLVPEPVALAQVPGWKFN